MEELANLWTIILSGGNGDRLRSFVRRLFGRERPKQYCAFVGTRTMFQHTVDRANQLAQPEHKVTVVAKSHMEHRWAGRKHVPDCSALIRRCPAGTFPQIFWDEALQTLR